MLLGFSFSRRLNKCVSEKSLKRFKAKVREMTSRTRGKRIETIVLELRQYIVGWHAYYRITQVPSRFKEFMDKAETPVLFVEAMGPSRISRASEAWS